MKHFLSSSEALLENTSVWGAVFLEEFCSEIEIKIQ